MSGTPDPDGFGMIHADDALAALGRELFQQNQCEEPYPSGGPMRAAAGSTTQYHPYLQMDSRNVSSDQQAVSIPVQTTKLEPQMEHQRLPTHITAADTAATPMSLMHALMPPMHMAVQPCHLGIPQSATPQSVMPPPPGQPPQGLWMPMNNFQMLCSLAGSRRDGDAMLQQPVISQPAAPPMIRSSLQLQHLQHNQLHQQHLQPPVLQQQLQQTRMKASQPESTNEFVAPTGNSTSTVGMPAPFLRSFEDTERFLDEASAEVLGPSVHNAYKCGYCGEVKLTASVGATADRRVRIRCKCGGKKVDGQPRMHAMWHPVPVPDPHLVPSLVPVPGAKSGMSPSQ